MHDFIVHGIPWLIGTLFLSGGNLMTVARTPQSQVQEDIASTESSSDKLSYLISFALYHAQKRADVGVRQIFRCLPETLTLFI